MSGILVLILRLLASGALYAFIGWALYTLWKDLKSPSSPAETIPTIQITPIGTDARMRSFDLPVITIGRAQTNTYQLLDNSISSTHARMSYHHQQWWLEDLASTNGTMLNNRPVSTPTVLIDGDQIQCGSVAFQIHITR
jgi:pSer/pThr/pTyr-binding forkhead associated (FHA) protein